MQTQGKESQGSMTPAEALELLREGNHRFRKNLKANRNLLDQVEATRGGQWPFAVVLSCIDSRTSIELTFDQGLGDVFSARIAGNFVNEDILGSMEFACKVAGAKLVLVLGHSHCGAVKGACDGVRMGNLTAVMEKLEPAVKATEQPTDASERTSANPDFVQSVAVQNVHRTVEEIRGRSEVLRDLEASGAIAMVGGMYDVETGVVEFHPSTSPALATASESAV